MPLWSFAAIARIALVPFGLVGIMLSCVACAVGGVGCEQHMAALVDGNGKETS